MPQELKPKQGRPVLPDGEARKQTLRIRLKDKELNEINNQCLREGLKQSEWCRKRLLA